MKVLITGGAGFIGLHLSRQLLKENISVAILDNFLPQIHGVHASLPPDLAAHVQLIHGDVADAAAVSRSLDGVDAVVHLAAETGTGQSMYEIARYARTNVEGTAQLFESIVKSGRPLQRFVIASSRAIYGEGAYLCERDGLVYPSPRSAAEKSRGLFDPLCPACDGACTTTGTPEAAPMQPSSFYGLTKQTQEQTALLFGAALGIPTVALRYQNVYGPGQSLRNPYTGILAIFSNLAREGRGIQVFEDGQESRDFVFIDDVIAATTAALLRPLTGCHSINVGSQERTTVLEIAQHIKAYFGSSSSIEVTGAFREGDIRHGSANIAQARALLGYAPQWKFEDGLRRFLQWAEASEPQAQGAYEQSLSEMRSRGLLRGQDASE